MVRSLVADNKKSRRPEAASPIDIFRIMADKNCLRIFACLNNGQSLTIKEISKILVIDDVLSTRYVKKLESSGLLLSQLVDDNLSYHLNVKDWRVSLLKKYYDSVVYLKK